MKKTLLLSVVASTMIMAGGDIAPVEPVVAAPVEVSGWDFSGQAAVWYQTHDFGANDLFSQGKALTGTLGNSRADFGLQLRAVNKDVFAGVGFGGEVSGLSTLNLENGVVSGVMQATGNPALGNDIDDITDGGWISQLYMTYGFGNTSFKAGRQELPKALSPFAFSEHWNVFANTFDSVLVVNTDLPNTTIVGAWVYGGNHNGISTNMTDFNSFNDDDGIYMLTVQNKSVEGLTLTGTWYYAPDYTSNHGFATDDDVNILWGDINYAFGDYYVAGQVGTVMGDFITVGANDTVAYGAKVGGNFGMFDASLAYSGVDDGNAGVFNVGGAKTPLYTQMILNQNFIKSDNDTFVARAGLKALGGKFGLAYDYTSDNRASNIANDYQELDLTYKTKVFNDSTTLFAGYIMRNWDKKVGADDTDNVLRFWAKYNF